MTAAEFIGLVVFSVVVATLVGILAIGIWHDVTRPAQRPVPAPEAADVLHVIPSRDLIRHSADEDCPCGPRADPVWRRDGSCGWVIVHHSLDGRKHLVGEAGGVTA